MYKPLGRLIGCGALLALALPSPARAIPATEPGMIAFTSDRDGNSEIYVADLSDGSEENLTTNPADDWSPKWSPFGTAMAFVSDRSGVASLHADALDGSDPVLISEIDGLDWAWSPDGRKIAWIQHRDAVEDLWITDIETGLAVNLTNGSRDMWGPSWSPDGRSILLGGWNDEGATDIFLISAEGGVARNLVPGSASGRETQWSPDGAHIALSSIEWDTGIVSLAVVEPDGSEPRVLIAEIGDQDLAGFVAMSWSPDGSRLVFGEQFVGGRHIWVDFSVIDVTAGWPTPLDVHGEYGSPAWSTDGTRIAIVSGWPSLPGGLPPYDESVALVDPDGENLVDLTGVLGVDETRSPTWSPDGSRLAFDARSGSDSAVYVVDADSTNLVEVGPGRSPDWKPAARRGVGLVDPATGMWHLEGVTGFYFGVLGDMPVLGDWDCDGIATPGVWRPSTGLTYLRNSLDTGIADDVFHFGVPGDVPLAGDWDGDGCDSLGVYRRGAVFLRNSLDTGAADIEYYFGLPGDQPFVGDFDADGIDEIGLYRQSDGLSYLKMEHRTGIADTGFPFAVPGDYPIAGDWDGDGVANVGAFRPAEHKFLLRNQHGAGTPADEFWMGRSTWLPVTASTR